MKIFTQEFSESSKKFGEDFQKYLSKSSTHLPFVFVALVMQVLGMVLLVPFANVGVMAWWNDYSKLNPNVIIEQTMQYWQFNVANVLISGSFIILTFVVFLMLVGWMPVDKQFKPKVKTPVQKEEPKEDTKIEPTYEE
jgi:hypothetical protein